VAGELLATGWPLAALIAGGVSLFAGEHDKARRLLERVEVNEHVPVYAQWGPLISAVLKSGRSTQPSAELLHFCGHADPWAAEWMAAYYTLIGNNEEAMVWIKTAIDRGFTNDRWWAELNPIMAPHRDNPEFTTLIASARRIRETEPV